MATIYLLGAFRLDADAATLFRGAEPMALGQRAVALLRALVERPGIPISKDALIEAAWPGLAIGESNLAVQISALRRVFGEEPGGEKWIETLQRRGYRFVGPVNIKDHDSVAASTPVSDFPTPTGAPSLPLPNKPSIAVLPFQNMSGDPEQEYFADGMVEEIITALSRFRSLFVIARNSSFTYKDRSVDVKQVGRELGVRYVLEGSVRNAASRVRITGQLIDVSTGAHLWAERFDGGLEDVFELQDQVTANVVGAIAPKLEQAEIDRIKRKPTASLDAYDYYLRAVAKFHRFASREANADALSLFNRAIELDPDFAAAYAMAADCYVIRKSSVWRFDQANEVAEAARLARRAVELGKDDAAALAASGLALAYVVRDLDAGPTFIDRALGLNPNLAMAWFFGGWVKIWLGEPDAAIERFTRAMRLSPLDPYMPRMQNGTAHAHFFSGRYDEASLWAAMVLRERPDFHDGLRIAAASHVLGERLDQANLTMARLRRLDPELRVSNLRDVQGPYRRPEDIARYEDAMRRAGLPE
jgi:TolB-like protein/tetratricopeptide (TPR) repeat protein